MAGLAVVTIDPLKQQAGTTGETAELTFVNGGWPG